MTDQARPASDIADEVHAMLRASICALNTQLLVPKLFGESSSDGVCVTLEVAERFMGDLIGRIEMIEMKAT